MRMQIYQGTLVERNRQACEKYYNTKGRSLGKEKHETQRAILNSYKLGIGCQRCGYKEHPAALDFDHIDPANKKYTVGKMTKTDIAKMWVEVTKCLVLCSNCHRIKTYEGKDR